jgi:hypothetical protein
MPLHVAENIRTSGSVYGAAIVSGNPLMAQNLTPSGVVFATTSGILQTDSAFLFDSTSNTIFVPNIAITGMTPGSVLFIGSSGQVSQNNNHFYWDYNNSRLGVGITNTPAAKLHVDTDAGENATALYISNDDVTYNSRTFHSLTRSSGIDFTLENYAYDQSGVKVAYIFGSPTGTAFSPNGLFNADFQTFNASSGLNTVAKHRVGAINYGSNNFGGFVDFQSTTTTSTTLASHFVMSGGQNYSLGINIRPNAASNTGLHIIGASAQTADLLRISDNSLNEWFSVGASDVVVNESSDDRDFRIEGSADASLFNLDGGNDCVAIGGAASSVNRKLIAYTRNDSIVANAENYWSAFSTVLSSIAIPSGITDSGNRRGALFYAYPDDLNFHGHIGEIYGQTIYVGTVEGAWGSGSTDFAYGLYIAGYSGGGNRIVYDVYGLFVEDLTSGNSLRNHIDGSTTFGVSHINAGNFKVSVQGSVGPRDDLAYDLGSTSYRWRNLHASSGIFTNSISSPFFVDKQIAFASGSRLIGESGFVWDYTNNRLGLNVGSPSEMLQLNDGNILLNKTDVTNRTITIQGSGGNTTFWELQLNRIRFGAGGSGLPIHFRLGTGFENVLYLSSTGVGVGTADPISAFHTFQNTTSTSTGNGITIENSGTGDSMLQFLLTGGQRYVAGIDNSDSDKFKLTPGENLQTSPAITANTSSQVGIGYDSPGFQLSLGRSLVWTKIALFDDAAVPYGIGLQGSELLFHVGNNNGKFSFYNTPSGTSRFTIAGTGTVGVNIASPTATFHVVPTVSSRTGVYIIGATSQSADLLHIVDSSTNEWFSVGATDAVFNESSQDRDFRIESNDNANMFVVDGGLNSIGVGYATPYNNKAVLMEVNGSVLAKNVYRHRPSQNLIGLWRDSATQSLVPWGRLVNRNTDFLMSPTGYYGTTLPTGYALYNNSGARPELTASVINYSGVPNSTNKVLMMNYSGGAGGTSPGFGGFVSTITLGPSGSPINNFNRFMPGNRILQVMWAKLPAGRDFTLASNSIGTSGTSLWLTPTSGTNQWEKYVALRIVDESGSLVNTGHIYVAGGADTSFVWYVASFEQIAIDEGMPAHNQGLFNVGHKENFVMDWGNLLSIGNTYLATDTGNVTVGTSGNPGTFRINVRGDVGPNDDNVWKLGSLSYRWAAIHAETGSIPNLTNVSGINGIDIASYLTGSGFSVSGIAGTLSQHQVAFGAASSNTVTGEPALFWNTTNKQLAIASNAVSNAIVTISGTNSQKLILTGPVNDATGYYMRFAEGTGTYIGSYFHLESVNNKFTIGMHNADTTGLADDSAAITILRSNRFVGIQHHSPISPLHLFEDSTNMGATAGFTIEQSGTGDSIVQFLLTGGQRWVAGIDNSDEDKFKIGRTADLSNNPCITLTTDDRIGLGSASVPSGYLHMVPAANVLDIVRIDNVSGSRLFNISPTGIALNSDTLDRDFRIYGLTDHHLLDVDGSNGCVAVGGLANSTNRKMIVYMNSGVVSSNTTNLWTALSPDMTTTQINAGVTDSGYRRGIAVFGWPDSTGFAGNLSSVFGISINHGVLAGTDGSGSINYSYGLYVGSYSGGPNKINNDIYGLFVEDLTSGTSQRNYIAGKMALGTTYLNPGDFQLSVRGDVGPHTTDVYSLGNSTYRWANIFAQSGIIGSGLSVGGNITTTSGNTFDIGSSGTPWRWGYFGNVKISNLNGVLKAVDGVIDAGATTTDLPEGANMYFTPSRMISSITGSGVFTPGSIIFANSTSGLSHDNEFYYDSTNRLMGIRTTSPQAHLHIRHAAARVRIESTSSAYASVSGALADNAASLQLVAAAQNTTTNPYSPPIAWGSTDPQFTSLSPKFLAAIAGRATETYNANTAGGMAIDFFTTANSAGSGIEMTLGMTINQNKYVGIGTGTPGAVLHVYNSLATNGTKLLTLEGERGWSFYQRGSGSTSYLHLTDDTGAKQFFIDTTSYFAKRNDATGSGIITFQHGSTNGRTSIGNTTVRSVFTPGATLEIYGESGVKALQINAIKNDCDVSYNSSGTTGFWYMDASTDSVGWGAGGVSSNYAYIFQRTSFAPAGMFDVRSSAGLSYFDIASSTTRFNTALEDRDWAVYGSGSLLRALITADAGSHAVGIGAGASASYQLVVQPPALGTVPTHYFAIRDSGSLDLFNVYSTGIVVNDGGFDRDLRIESTGISHMFVVDAGTNTINIANNTTTSGLLSISGANPEKLFITGPANDPTGYYIRFAETTTTYQGSYIHYDSTNNKFHLGVHAAANNSYASDTPGITIVRDSTLVGINQITPTAQLHIVPTASTTTGLYIVGAVSQSADYTRMVDSSSNELFSIGSTDAIFNEAGLDRDFRIESTTSSASLFVDGGNGTVCINTAAGTAGQIFRTLADYPDTTSSGTNFYRNHDHYATTSVISPGMVDLGYRVGAWYSTYFSNSGFQGTLASQYGIVVQGGTFDSSETPSGTISNVYGVYVSLSKGVNCTHTNEWGFYQVGRGNNYLAGQLRVATTSNAGSFQINSAGHVGPQSNLTYDLGSDSYKWRNIYGGSGIFQNVTISGSGLSMIVSYPGDVLNTQVVFASGDNQFAGNNNFVWNHGTDRVGIHRSSPSGSLHVSSQLNSSPWVSPLVRFQRTGGGNWIDFSADASANWITTDDAGSNQKSLSFYVGCSGGDFNLAHTFGFAVSGGTTTREVMRIRGSGLVGINTTAPTGTLTIFNHTGNPGVITLAVKAINSQIGPLLDTLNTSNSSLLQVTTSGITVNGGLTSSNFRVASTNNPTLFNTHGTSNWVTVGGTGNPGSFRMAVSGDLGPESSGTRSLGSAAYPWNNIWTNNINGSPASGGGSSATTVDSGRIAFGDGTTLRSDSNLIWDSGNQRLGINAGTSPSHTLSLRPATTTTIGMHIVGNISQAFDLLHVTDASSNELFSVGVVDTIVNEGGSDRDFRVETDGLPFMFYVDGGLNYASFGAATNPGSFLVAFAGDIGPEAHGTRDLGSSSYAWNNLYVSNDSSIYYGTNAEIYANNGTGNIAFAGSGCLAFKLASGTVTTERYFMNASGFSPWHSNNYDLGTVNRIWRNLYCSSLEGVTEINGVPIDTYLVGSGGGAGASGVISSGTVLFGTNAGTISGETAFSWDSTNNRLGVNVGSRPLHTIAMQPASTSTIGLHISALSAQTADLVTITDISSNEHFSIGVSDIIINEAGLDRDFRVEGDADSSLIFADAGLDEVAIGAPPSGAFKFTVNGNIGPWTSGVRDLGASSLTFRNLYLSSTGTINVGTGILSYSQSASQFSTNSSVVITGSILVSDSTSGSPGIGWRSDTNTGFWRIGTDDMGFSAAGVGRFRFDTSKISPLQTVSYDLGATNAYWRKVYVDDVICNTINGVAPGGGGSIGGSIAANQIAYGASANTIAGNNNLWWDNSSVRMGIGTNSPDTILHIDNGTSNTYLTLEKDDARDCGIRFDKAGTVLGSMILDSVDNLVIETDSANDDIKFKIHTQGYNAAQVSTEVTSADRFAMIIDASGWGYSTYGATGVNAVVVLPMTGAGSIDGASCDLVIEDQNRGIVMKDLSTGRYVRIRISAGAIITEDVSS